MAFDVEWNVTLERLMQPASLMLAAANLLPLAGVLLWGWDVFLVLVVFWFETVIVAFWTVFWIALTPRDGLARAGAGLGGKPGESGSPVGLALFFAAHSGIFLGVHFMFLWQLFSGAWPRAVDGIGDFFRVVMMGTGLWVALCGLFAAHGLRFLRQATGRDPLRLLGALLWGGAAGEQDRVAPSPESALAGSALILLYGRIIVMQVAIILGGMLALALGSMGPLLILIVAKTFVDLSLVPREETGA